MPADRLAELLPFHCADADRDSSLKFTCGDEYHMATLDTGCCALWDFQQVGPVGQVLSDLYRNAFISQSRRTCGNTFVCPTPYRTQEQVVLHVRHRGLHILYILISDGDN